MYKFHLDPKFISNREKRSRSLQPYVPNVRHESENIYSYSRASGTTLSKLDHEFFFEFLSFAMDFWSKTLDEIETDQIKIKILNFYKEKTSLRVKEFLNKEPYKVSKINDENVSDINSLIQRIDWDKVQKNIRIVRSHGDLHPDNIIFDTSRGEFTLLDWRQDIAGYTDFFGDIYYDLAKILHGLIVDHELVQKNQFESKINEGEAHYGMDTVEKKKKWIKEFKSFCSNNDIDFELVEFHTALIYLNIATLHHDPYDQFLFILGHSMLNRSNSFVKSSDY
jgi:hypothetical protein